ncbi:hypothetical protein OIU76_015274 [Salix suchowensis]|nr:hypothetical protein OIU76_015274 [Salix suchowensis]
MESVEKKGSRFETSSSLDPFAGVLEGNDVLLMKYLLENPSVEATPEIAVSGNIQFRVIEEKVLMQNAHSSISFMIDSVTETVFSMTVFYCFN